MKGRLAATLLIPFLLTLNGLAQNSAMPARTGMNNGMGVTISGSVVTPQGEPISEARIEVRELQTGTILASGYTRTNGSFEFSALPMTSYELIAVHGMAETRERVPAGEMNAAVTLRLSPADPNTQQADGSATVSVAEYKVPEKAREAYHKAEGALAKNKLEDVGKYLNKALDIYPSYAPALTLQAVMALDKNDPQTAVDELDKAIHSDPGYAVAYTAMGAALNQLSKFDDALRACDRAVTLAPNAWQPYFEMAKSYFGKADYPHALEQLARTQREIPHDYAPIHLMRAHVLLRLKNYNDAVSELQAFLTLAPQDSQSPQARETLAKVKAYIATTMPAQPAVTAAR
jgi:Flp pilus assembly protein TadD, contains TPR repeats